MPKYSRLKKEHLQLCYDPGSDWWMHVSISPYHSVKWKHLPKYAREAIPVLNIAGHGVWVHDMGETRCGAGGLIYYTILDPIRLWEIDLWRTRR